MSTNAFIGAARSTAASGSLVYEGERAVHEYLQFHFGKPGEVLPYDCGPKEALDFPKRCADLCVEAVVGSVASRSEGEQHGTDRAGGELEAGASLKQPLRAMDVGCAVGGISFELTRSFDEVVGVDFSASFVEAAEQMRVGGRTEYEYLEQGSAVFQREAVLPEGTVPSRASFSQGDACSLDVEALGSFDAVLASNLLCRLPKPQSFLEDLPALVKPGGVAVLISPYSWLKEYTAPSEWLGGFREGEGEDGEGQLGGEFVDSFERIRSIMEADVPAAEAAVARERATAGALSPAPELRLSAAADHLSSKGLTSARLGSNAEGWRCIPGLENPYPAHTPSEARGSGCYNSDGQQRSPYHKDGMSGAVSSDPSHGQPPLPAMKVPMSHGGLTSSSAYGSGHGADSAASVKGSRHTPQQNFGGFGGQFGERSLQSGRSGVNRGTARGLPPGYAPSSGGGVDAALSSNAFASGHNQNCGNVITGRPSSRVTAPPGGHSTFSLG
eukprot:g12571.t1